MKLLRQALSAAAVILLAGCATSPLPVADYNPLLVEHYTLDSGDELRVIVFDQADLSNTYSVDKGGYVTVPLVGAVPARGKTTQALEAEVAAKLRAGFIRDPDVSVEVERYRPFFIMGEVTTAGQYSYVAGLTVQQAIAVAGGFTPRANKARVDVVRQMGGNIAPLHLGMVDAVFPGDTITVRERLF
jgi:polysaccharide export outer membrane protein